MLLLAAHGFRSMKAWSFEIVLFSLLSSRFQRCDVTLNAWELRLQFRSAEKG